MHHCYSWSRNPMPCSQLLSGMRIAKSICWSYAASSGSHGIRNVVLNLNPSLSDSKLHAIPTLPVLPKLPVIQNIGFCFLFPLQTNTWSNYAWLTWSSYCMELIVYIQWDLHWSEGREGELKMYLFSPRPVGLSETIAFLCKSSLMTDTSTGLLAFGLW